MTTERMQSQSLEEALATRPREDLAPEDVDTGRVLARIQARNKLLDVLVPAAIQATHSGQWVDRDGKPWPMGAACETMARRCGVSWHDLSVLRLDRTDDHEDRPDFYYYVAKATFVLAGSPIDRIEAEGTCSSRDEFLGTETRLGRGLSEINEDDIRKAAITNCIVNGVTRLLGVRNMAWEQLEPLGVKRDGAAKIDYRTGGRGGQAKAGDARFRFGSGKGKTVAEVTDKDLAWYRTRHLESISDPEKAKWKAENEAMVAAIDAEIARRRGGGAETSGAPAGGAAGAPAGAPGSPGRGLLQQIRDMFPASASQEEVVAAIAAATGKARGGKLEAGDVEKVRAYLTSRGSVDAWGLPQEREPGSDG